MHAFFITDSIWICIVLCYLYEIQETAVGNKQDFVLTEIKQYVDILSLSLHFDSAEVLILRMMVHTHSVQGGEAACKPISLNRGIQNCDYYLW